MNQYNVVHYNRETAPLIQADKKVYFEKIELEDATCFFPAITRSVLSVFPRSFFLGWDPLCLTTGNANLSAKET